MLVLGPAGAVAIINCCVPPVAVDTAIKERPPPRFKVWFIAWFLMNSRLGAFFFTVVLGFCVTITAGNPCEFWKACNKCAGICICFMFGGKLARVGALLPFGTLNIT